MTSDPYQDIAYDRTAKGAKRPIRPKLLKLTDVTIPHRNRKKTKVKSKDRSQSSVRDRIYDDPAYTDDISHLANPMRRSSCSGKAESHPTEKVATSSGGSLGKRSKLAREFLQYARHGKGRFGSYEQDGSSSSDNMTSDKVKVANGKRGRSLERQEKGPKKREKRDRSAKQKRNLSLDNNLPTVGTSVEAVTTISASHQSVERSSEVAVSRHSGGGVVSTADRALSYSRTMVKATMFPKQISDGVSESRKLTDVSKAATTTGTTDNDEVISARSSSKESNSSKMQIGRKFLRGEIGIKSFNYYLLKEGLKTSKKFVEKQKNSLAAGLGSKKQISRSEENIYEEIYFKERPSDIEGHHKRKSVIPAAAGRHEGKVIYADCELCIQQCTKENCEYCYEMARESSIRGGRQMPMHAAHQIEFGSLGRRRSDSRSYINQKANTPAVTAANEASPQPTTTANRMDTVILSPPNAHILEFQSYNPNNPGVYKIETTPVAITGEYNPILQFQQPESKKQQATGQQHVTSSHCPGIGTLPPIPKPRRASKMTGGAISAISADGFVGNFITNQQVQNFLINHNGGGGLDDKTDEFRGGYIQRKNTKSSSSSDSLHHQQQQLHHKFSTISRLEAQAAAGDPLFSEEYLGGIHPLMYASRRPIGGSQILVDPNEYPKIYKSDSKASIMSEFSFRSSDNYSNQRNFRYGGGGEVSDSSLGDSLFSYSTTTAKRYFGSSESCRFAFECRRCSLDGSGGTGGEKCSLSDNCRYECRHCDCSSSYFSSDFDELNYAGVSSGHNKNGSVTKSQYDCIVHDGLNRKQNKYAQDFFKHVNDVKRSIYQAELQGAGYDTIAPIAKPSSQQQQIQQMADRYNQLSNIGGRGRYTRGSPFRSFKIPPAPPPSIYSTLPLTKERSKTNSGASSRLSKQQSQPKPTPRTSIQKQPTNTSTRKSQTQQTERIELPSTDVTSHRRNTTTGAIPKTGVTATVTVTEESLLSCTLAPKGSTKKVTLTDTGNSIVMVPMAENKQSPRQSPKIIHITDTPSGSQQEDKAIGKISNSFTEIPCPDDVREIAEASSRSKDSQTMTSKSKESIDGKECQKSTIERTHLPSTSSLREQSPRKAKKTYDKSSKNANAETMASNSLNTSITKIIPSHSCNETKNDDAIICVQIMDNEVDSSNNVGKILVKSADGISKPNDIAIVSANLDAAIEEEDDDVFYDARSEDSAGGGRRSVNSSGYSASGIAYCGDSTAVNNAALKGKRENIRETLTDNMTKSTLESVGISNTSPNENTTKDNDAVTLNPSVAQVGNGTFEMQEKCDPSIPMDKTDKMDKTNLSTTSDTCCQQLESDTIVTHPSSSTESNTSTATRKRESSILVGFSPALSPVPAPREALQEQQQLKRSPSPLALPRRRMTMMTAPTIEVQRSEMSFLFNVASVDERAVKQVAQQTDESENSLQVKNDMVAEGTEHSALVENTKSAKAPTTTTANSCKQVTAAVEREQTTMTRKSSITISVTPTPPGESANDFEAVAGATTTSEVSRDSDLAGVATAVAVNRLISNQNASSKCHQQQHQQLQKKRPPLYRQDYSCLDSSEAASDDSRLTRDSYRSSQNDELSSSAPDKIDISNLPLPALPVKKRRSRSRAGPQTSALQQLSKQHEADNLTSTIGESELSKATKPSEFSRSSYNKLFPPRRRESLEQSSRSFGEKLEIKKMHYHPGATTSAGAHKPATYLFGENRAMMSASKKSSPSNRDEIFLNKSGWVQVNSKRINDENSPGGSRNRRLGNLHRFEQQNGSKTKSTIRIIQIDSAGRNKQSGSVYAVPKLSGSKIEELISRSEARRNSSSAQRTYLKPGYKIIDPQIATILNERPGFLPVKSYLDSDSPPPVTPILSPPPAFQDSKSAHLDHRIGVNSRLDPDMTKLNNNYNSSGKGMVFSRSFEYDNRKSTADSYIETFSRSFDCNLSDKPPPQRDRSPNFSTLTGCSPNYLTKKDATASNSNVIIRSRDSSPKYQQQQQLQQQQQSSTQAQSVINTTAYLNTAVKEAPPVYSNSNANVRSKLDNSKPQFDRVSCTGGRSRKAQFSRGQTSCQQQPTSLGVSRFRFDTNISQRLNSCDSGARSDLSNDELDNEDDESTEFLTTNYHTSSPFKQQKQRSLTPDRNDSQSSSSSLRKQRSLTPESRSLTPEDRRKKGSQLSLGSRQNSSSRSNTLERKQKFDDKSLSISRSSSSSSYSGRGGDHDIPVPLTSVVHRRSTGRSSKTSEEHRIRRSRSLQLTERSPSRSHKMIACVGQQHSVVNQAAPVYHQSQMRGSGSSGSGVSNFPPTIRTTINQQIIANSGSRVFRSTDIDKSRSFDFDYGTYNNQNAPNRLDFDKSRSFDDDYRETSNNNISGISGMRYLHADPGHGQHKIGRRSSPGPKSGAGSGGSGHSPQSSGSSSTNAGGGGGSAPRQTSPQNYGTRLCDHELTYDMLRRSLDRSPIMDFGRDYDIQTSMKNRETINAGGNSELNFLSSERIYEHPTTIKRSQNLSPNGSNYSLDRLHSSRDSITPDSANEFKAIISSDERLRSEYLYRQQQQQQRAQQQGNNRGSLVSYAATSCKYSLHCSANSKLNKAEKYDGSTNDFDDDVGGECDHVVSKTCRVGDSDRVTKQSFVFGREDSDKTHHDKSLKVQRHYSTGNISKNISKRSHSGGDKEPKVIAIRRQDSSTKIIIKTGTATPPFSRTSTVFLGDCEMPITREDDYQCPKKISSVGLHSNSQGKKAVAALRPSVIVLNSKSSRTSKQMSVTTIRKCWTNTQKLINRSPTSRTGYQASEQGIRQKSVSLPDVLVTSEFPTTNATHDVSRSYCNNGKQNQPSSNLKNQIRAVSSPSLTENKIEEEQFDYKRERNSHLIPTPGERKFRATPNLTSTCTVNGHTVSANASSSSSSSSSVSSSGVLQKFKKTFSNFKHSSIGNNNTPSSSSIVTPTIVTVSSTSITHGVPSVNTTSSATTIVHNSSNANDVIDSSGKYRFGPLTWRSSKERHKAKYNRRDKCNSGDSGIQIELENDEQFARVIDPNNKETKTSSTAKNRIRRANSAKSSSTPTSALSVKAKVLKKIESCDGRVVPTSIPARSLSQPNGLDRLSATRFPADLDESDTDSVSSHPDLNDGKIGHHRPIYAEVLYNFSPASQQELALERGALVEILRKEIGPWWYGRKKSDAVVDTLFEPHLGWFPKDFVRIIQFPESDGFISGQQQRQRKLASPSLDETLIAISGSSNNITTIVVEHPSSALASTSMNANNHSLVKYLNSERSNPSISNVLRNNAIKELLETEINYVKLLSSLCTGYLTTMRERGDIFSSESLSLIFSNIESIWKFQKAFLNSLRCGIEMDNIAQVFLQYQKQFLVYSTYCNAYPRAVIELETYARNKEANTILENCRIAENLPELPLSAHLLAPIQRICRYPLHLAELIKSTIDTSCPCKHQTETNSDEVDSHSVDSKESLECALVAMKRVTEAVNEGKRHSENLARHQENFENFQGPPLHFHSTRYFTQIDATRVSPNLWNNTYTLFLFDHQLIYCKKDILKRNHFIYKGRIFLDSCRILNLPDGKIFGVTVKNALRIFCDSRNKWFDFSFRSSNRKRRFLSTLAMERQFCGKNLFVSELAGDEDDNISDREYHSDYEASPIGRDGSARDHPRFRGRYDETTCSSLNLNWKENIYESSSGEKNFQTSARIQKYSDTLPKKSQKGNSSTSKDSYDYNTGSLGRRKIGNWFRKSKSTNSTPNQSPTHNPSNVVAFNSDTSSQSSPAVVATKTQCNDNSKHHLKKSGSSS